MNSTVEVPFSDHSAVISHVQLNPKLVKDTVSKASTNYDMMRERLIERFYDFPVFSYNDPNAFLSDFISVFKDTYAKCTTIVTTKCNSKVELCPWMNDHLIRINY